MNVENMAIATLLKLIIKNFLGYKMARVLFFANIPYLFLILLFFSSSIESKLIPITIDKPITEQERQWGLMQQKSLPDNYGMLFSYSPPKHISLWAFNCFVDITVAYIDEKNVIREIKHLKAHPQMMDPRRPVRNVDDIKKYSVNEPICQFFMKESIISSRPFWHALEMGSAFFEKSGIDVCDVLHFKDSKNAVIIKTKNLSKYLSTNQPLERFSLHSPEPIAVSMANHFGIYEIKFYSANGSMLLKGLLKSTMATHKEEPEVLICTQAVSQIEILKIHEY